MSQVHDLILRRFIEEWETTPLLRHLVRTLRRDALRGRIKAIGARRKRRSVWR